VSAHMLYASHPVLSSQKLSSSQLSITPKCDGKTFQQVSFPVIQTSTGNSFVSVSVREVCSVHVGPTVPLALLHMPCGIIDIDMLNAMLTLIVFL